MNNLHQRRLLARRRLKEDRRVVKLWLTEDGQRLAPELVERVMVYNEMLAEGVTREERDAFVSAYNKVMRNYARYRDRQTEVEKAEREAMATRRQGPQVTANRPVLGEDE